MYTPFNYRELKRRYTKADMESFLIEQGLTYRELQEKYGFNERLWSRLASEYDIPKQFKNIRKAATAHCKRDLDEQQIIDMYVNQGYSMRAISCHFECNPQVIRRILDECLIPIRPFNDKLYYQNNCRKRQRSGWRIDTNGYVCSITTPGVREHREVMERYLQRPLTSEEHVHHIDFDKTNNQIENLYLFPTIHHHMLYHGYIKTHSYISPDAYMDYYNIHLDGKINDYNWLYHEYIELNKSCNQIAQELDVSREAVTGTLKSMGIFDMRLPSVN